VGLVIDLLYVYVASWLAMSRSGKKKGKSELGRAILKERNRGRRGGSGSGSWVSVA